MILEYIDSTCVDIRRLFEPLIENADLGIYRGVVLYTINCFLILQLLLPTTFSL